MPLTGFDAESKRGAEAPMWFTVFTWVMAALIPVVYVAGIYAIEWITEPDMKRPRLRDVLNLKRQVRQTLDDIMS